MNAAPNDDMVIEVEPPKGFHNFLGVVGLSWWPKDSWDYFVSMKYDHNINGKSFITVRPTGDLSGKEQVTITIRFGVIYQ